MLDVEDAPYNLDAGARGTQSATRRVRFPHILCLCSKILHEKVNTTIMQLTLITLAHLAARLQLSESTFFIQIPGTLYNFSVPSIITHFYSFISRIIT